MQRKWNSGEFRREAVKLAGQAGDGEAAGGAAA